MEPKPVNAVHQSGHNREGVQVDINYGTIHFGERPAEAHVDSLLDWFSPASFSAQQRQNDSRERRQPGTGRWFLASTEYLEWRGQPAQTLLCSGIPGAGKTFIASLAIDDVWLTYGKRTDVGRAHLYCNYNSTGEQDLSSLLSSLSRQLLQTRSDGLKSARTLYFDCQKRDGPNGRPSLDELVATLRDLMSRYARTFVVVDAVDECQDRTRHMLLNCLFQLQSMAENKVSLLITTRPMPDVLNRFQNTPRLDIRATESDIGGYLDGQILHLSYVTPRIFGNKELCTKIKEAIIHCADGMFLLAQLHLESLADMRTPRDVVAAIQTLREGFQGLSSAYDGAKDRIESKMPRFRNLARQVLGWITYAQRPLTVQELRHAIPSKPGRNRITDDDLEDPTQMISVCVGLVTIDPESTVIRLVHYTTQEYLETVRDSWLPGFRADIAGSCLAYMLLDIFSDCPYDDLHFLPQRNNSTKEPRRNKLASLERNAFRRYVASYWDLHVADQQSNPQIIHLTMPFLTSKSRFDRACEVMRQQRLGLSDPGYGDVYEISPMQFLARFGLCTLAHVYLGLHPEAAETESKGYTPLHFAASAGQVEFVQFLLAQKNVDINFRRRHGGTPLHCAVLRRQSEVVKLLLSRTDIKVNESDSDGNTALHLTMLPVHLTIVQLLLARTEDSVLLNMRVMHSTMLLRAAEREEEALVEILLARLGRHKQWVNMPDGSERTPLEYAKIRGYSRIAELLRSYGAIETIRGESLSLHRC